MSTPKNGVFYRHAVEAVFERVVRVRQLDTPTLRQELTSIGVDFEKPRDVDLATWLRVLKAVARVLAPGVPEAEALSQLGRVALEGYASTLVGQGALLVSKLAGVKRSMVRAAEAWGTANNIYVVTTEDRGPKCVAVLLNVAGELTPYNRGILYGVLSVLGAKGTVDSQERPDGVTYVVTWE